MNVQVVEFCNHFANHSRAQSVFNQEKKNRNGLLSRTTVSTHTT